MKRDHRLRVLAYLTIVFWTVIFLQPPIPQDLAYHQFADQRTLFGIPHCLNVLSNLPFLLVGLWGFSVVFRLATDPEQQAFVRPADSLAYQILFLGVALVGLGSTYYHLAPSNETLLWDRLPMSIAFMAFLATAITERLDRRAGIITLLPLIAFGVFSVLYWHLYRAGRSRRSSLLHRRPSLPDSVRAPHGSPAAIAVHARVRSLRRRPVLSARESRRGV